jgi:magnesium transporter
VVAPVDRPSTGGEMTRTRLYSDGALVADDFPPSEISERLEADEQAFVWLHLTRPSEDDLALLPEEFGLHRLAIEDALHAQQRTKLDRYETHLFMAAYAVRADGGSLSFHEVDAFITQRALITIGKDDGLDVEQLMARWDETADLTGYGVSFLIHSLLDLLVDDQFAAVQALDTAIEELEDLLFDDRPSARREVQRRSYALRRDLVRLRQVVLPLREVVNSLMRPTLHVVEERLLPFYQDVYDHVLRVVEWTESLRDLVTTALETNLTVQGNRMNLIMKKVTSWAAIIAVPTAVTSFYGQNVPYPGYQRSWGFLSSAVVMVGLAALLYMIFRRKDWL